MIFDDLTLFFELYRMRLMVLLIAELEYKNDASGYVKGSVRSFLTYSACNGPHGKDDLNKFRANPIIERIDLGLCCHIGKRFNFYLSPRNRLAIPHINGAAVPLTDKNDYNFFGTKSCREMLLLLRSMAGGDRDKNSYD
jgi:hypothetical protein